MNNLELKGKFMLVLHSHIPYVRMKGKWPHGEEMIFEAISETYVPLILKIKEIKEFNPKITIGLTPILLEQLNDIYLKKEYIKYLKQKISLAKKDIKIYSGSVVIKDKTERLQLFKLINNIHIHC